jgi:outer membrane protein assembly factor BamB
MKEAAHFFIGILLCMTATAATDLKENILYLYPRPGALHANPNTTLIIRFKKVPSVCPEFQVTGSKSGTVSGRIHSTQEPNTFNFVGDKPFREEESITVTVGLDRQQYQYTWKTCRTAPRLPEFEHEDYSLAKSSPSSVKVMGEPAILANGVSVPSDFPYIDVTVNNNPSEGKLFLNNWSDTSPYIIMFNADGTPYWYQKTPDRRRDFKVQRNGMLTARLRNYPGGAFIEYDSTYAVVDTFLAAPGYDVDEHECQVLENGHYLLVALDYRMVDMSQYFEGGRTNAGVSFSHLEEFDSEGNLLLHFDSQEKLDIREYTQIEEDIKEGGRFPHLNAIDVDDDNNLVFSCRHLSAVYKIERETGEIIWKLGGINSDFTFVDDPLNGFSGQHAVRVLGNNHYILFDNGNKHNPRTSRAVEYVLDTENMTATLVWEYRQEPGTQYSHYMGNAQRLKNGNTLINWAEGGRPKATEVTPEGVKVYEMNFVNHYDCYRTHKFDWNVPAETPALMIESGTTGATLIFNQFGAQDVAYYNIYHGTEPDPTALLDTSRLTLKTVSDLENRQYHYFRVTSVNQQGVESDFSNQVATFVKELQPGDNLFLNSDFSASDDFWLFGMMGEIQGSGMVEEGVYHLSVTSITSGAGRAYLVQYPMELLSNETYVFEFDAWASKRIQIQPLAVSSYNINLDYSRIGAILIGTNPEHYSFEFEKRPPSVTDAIAGIMVETTTGEIFVDNVELKQVVSSGIENQNPAARTFRLGRNYPNPFNGETIIHFTIPSVCEVTLTLYDILGKKVRTFVDKTYMPGAHQVIFRDESLSSGVYFYKMEARDGSGPVFESVQKMILMK